MTGLIISYTENVTKEEKPTLKQAISLGFATLPQVIGGGLTGQKEMVIQSSFLFIADIETGAVSYINPLQMVHVLPESFGIETPAASEPAAHPYDEPTQIISLTQKK
jgi:hypothetical protein